MQTTEPNDAELVSASLDGDREAFRKIVERYQTLICSLGYCATGNVGQSEDLAQETFVTAWNKLAELREPARLRSWLCGITRFLISKEFRRQGREPIHAAETLETDEWPAPEPLPVDNVISGEEKTILWRSLERVPQIYREPLVLFYREHQSIEAVAKDLELSEDAVKQRLSRGRKLLTEQFLAVVADALKQTTPGKAFASSVLASLPVLTYSAKAATIGITAAKGGAAAKSAGMMGLFAVLLGPVLVFLPNYLAYRIGLAGAQSDEERAGIKSLYGKVGAITLAMFVPFVAVVWWLSRHQTNHSSLTGVLATGLVLLFLPTMLVVAIRSQRKGREYYQQLLAGRYGGVFPEPAWEFRSSGNLFSLPLVHVRVGDRFSHLKPPVKAWIAIGDRAIGGLFAFGGLAIAPLSIGGLSLGAFTIGGVSVGIIGLGGITLGGWALFGGLCVGWQATGCIAIAWSAAAGNIALAHDFADGSFARTVQGGGGTLPPLAQQLHATEPNLGFRCAEFINNHWLWLNLFWMIPFLVQWLILRHSKETKQN